MRTRKTRTYTVALTFVGIALCLVHFLFHDYDSIYLLFYAFSVPAWFATVVTNVHEISMAKMLIIYLLTVATWTLIGFTIDWFTTSYRHRSKSE